MILATNLTWLSRRIVGLSPNNLLALDDNGKLPSVDGSQFTNMPIPGVGQTWKAVSRTIGTVYQNPTNKEIKVYVRGYHGAQTGVAYVGTTNTPDVEVFNCSVGASTTGTQMYVSGIISVPPGNYYKTTGGLSIISECS